MAHAVDQRAVDSGAFFTFIKRTKDCYRASRKLNSLEIDHRCLWQSRCDECFTSAALPTSAFKGVLTFITHDSERGQCGATLRVATSLQQVKDGSGIKDRALLRGRCRKAQHLRSAETI